MSKAIVWTIAGSDSSGGAGIQADLQTFRALGVHGCSVVTAITAQNTHEASVHYPQFETIAEQIDVLQNDFPPNAIKIGMLGSSDALASIVNFLKQYADSVILDPVMIASSGKRLFAAEPGEYIARLATLFPYVSLFTPNIPECEMLLNRRISSLSDMEAAARQLLSLGLRSVYIKGGHLDQENACHDFWTNGKESFWLSGQRYEAKNYRGTGCTFSAAVTACLASGYELKDAIVIARMYVSKAIRLAWHWDMKTAFLCHEGWPEDGIDLPYLAHNPVLETPQPYPDCGPEKLGLYPVVDNGEWLRRLLPAGINTVQLRIKDLNGYALEKEIRQAIDFARQYQARLFINDYWELAIAHQAYGVHLGQEDLQSADLRAIRTAGLRLGISTHCYYEVARAHACRPSYIACGPVYATTSKLMPFPPQGVNNLQRWTKTLSQYAVVAIGGINRGNIKDIQQTRVNGIAMISAITQADDPVQAACEFLAGMDTRQ